MKLKLVVLLQVAAAVILGFFIGRFHANYSRGQYLKRIEELHEAERSQRATANFLKQIERSAADRALDDFLLAISGLIPLQKGDTNEAIEALESRAEDTIVLVAAMLQDLPVEERDRKHLSRVRWWRDYCAAHPHKSSWSNELAAFYISLLSTNR